MTTLDDIITLVEKEGDYYKWEYKGYPCKIKRIIGLDKNEPNREYGGYWCGYTQLPKGHPYLDIYYEAIPVDVHGGITYMDGYNWIGFACCNLEDARPYDLKSSKFQDPEILLKTRHYWTKEEVIKETEKLVDQLIKKL